MYSLEENYDVSVSRNHKVFLNKIAVVVTSLRIARLNHRKIHGTPPDEIWKVFKEAQWTLDFKNSEIISGVRKFDHRV